MIICKFEAGDDPKKYLILKVEHEASTQFRINLLIDWLSAKLRKQIHSFRCHDLYETVIVMLNRDELLSLNRNSANFSYGNCKD